MASSVLAATLLLDRDRFLTGKLYFLTPNQTLSYTDMRCLSEAGRFSHGESPRTPPLEGTSLHRWNKSVERPWGILSLFPIISEFTCQRMSHTGKWERCTGSGNEVRNGEGDQIRKLEECSDINRPVNSVNLKLPRHHPHSRSLSPPHPHILFFTFCIVQARAHTHTHTHACSYKFARTKLRSSVFSESHGRLEQVP